MTPTKRYGKYDVRGRAETKHSEAKIAQALLARGWNDVLISTFLRELRKMKDDK